MHIMLASERNEHMSLDTTVYHQLINLINQLIFKKMVVNYLIKLPVSQIEFTANEVCTGQSMRCRDPLDRSEFFVRDLRLKTFN